MSGQVGLVVHPRRDLALQVEGETVLRAAGDHVQVTAHRPEERLGAAERAVLVGGQQADVDQLAGIVHLMDVLADPVERVKVARRSKYRQHAPMEADGALEDHIPLGELESEEFELPDRIDRVNGALHRQMHIVHLHQQQRLFDDAETLLLGELCLSFTRIEEGPQIYRCSAGSG